MVTPPSAAGVCHVAVVLLVAVSTWPELGAVAALTLTVVVADFNAFAMSAVPHVAAFKLDTRVVELTTRGAVPVATVLMSWDAVDIAPVADIFACEFIQLVAILYPYTV